MKLNKTLQIFLTLMALWVVTAPDAHAYIDPGSGTLLWQFALAAFFGSLFFIRQAGVWMKRTLQSLWTKIRGTPRA